MHIYNAWLPPAVAKQVEVEKEAFSECVRRLQETWRPQQLSSRSHTIKFISVINNFLKAKSDLAIGDVELLVKVVLDLILHSEDNLYVQARWGGVLAKVLKKYRKKLKLEIRWQPFYEILMQTNFKRRQGFEGFALRKFQIEHLISLIRNCRQFFPPGSAAEIWDEFRPMLEDLSHNSSLVAAGFISLLLPTNAEKHKGFYTSEWLDDCLQLWSGIPNCHYWDLQWASLIGRCMKHHSKSLSFNAEPFLPRMFTHFLNSFEVPVGKGSTSSPHQREIPGEAALAFGSGWSFSLSRDIAKAIVFLLKPGSSIQKHFEIMIDLLEQYYHPSNGGSWTSSLESFLRNLVFFFLRRLAQEERMRVKLEGTSESKHFLGLTERRAFVKAVLRLIERGQYSKNAVLCGTCTMALSRLSFVEPALILPLVVSRFYTALDSITAIHQLEVSIMAVALCARSLLLASFKETSLYSQVNEDDTNKSEEYIISSKEVLVYAMFNTLQGLDANDPPKTLATLQLFCSLFSSLGKLGEKEDGGDVVLPIDWSQWLDDLLSRLFSLVLHLDPSGQPVEARASNEIHLSSQTFLMQGESYFLSMLELMFCRLTSPLRQQALKKVAKFVNNHVITGAVAEVGLLCSALVYAAPEEAITQLIEPLINSVLSSLKEAVSTGLKAHISPALERLIVYQLNVLSVALTYSGASILRCKNALKDVIAAAFDAPASKVNEAGDRVLCSVLGSLILYYPHDQYKLHTNYLSIDGIEDWIDTKEDHHVGEGSGPCWHCPNKDESTFANELLNLHLLSPLKELRAICEESKQVDMTSIEKERLRVMLLRVDASLRGARSCLVDFEDLKSRVTGKDHITPSYIAGAAGVSVGDKELRQYVAETMHIACTYLLEKWADDSSLLMLLARNMDVVGNCGSIEYGEWMGGKQTWRADYKSLVEPPTNFITDRHTVGKRRPKWMIIEMVFLHNTWRASQSQYNWYRVEPESYSTPDHILLLTRDLLKLSLHKYDAVRLAAGSSLKKLFKRFPVLIQECVPVLLRNLQDTTASEEVALGACAVLTSKAISRYLSQDCNALASFLLGILNSAHHESIKAQTAINELFILFSLVGAVPVDSTWKEGEATMSYTDLIMKIKQHSTNNANIHWRYHVMAQGMLLILLVAPSSTSACCSLNEVLSVRQIVAGHFLRGLKSELPPLRPLSAVALLLLLQASPYKMMKETGDNLILLKRQKKMNLSVESSLTTVLQESDFGKIVLSNLAFDHHYAEGQIRSSHGGAGRSIRQSLGDVGLTACLPSFCHDWPRTRTWDPALKGDAFSPRFAKLFKRLIQECGSVALEAFRAPLEDAATALEEQAKQCVAAEILAGFLQSDVQCVIKAWNDWLQPLFRKVLLQSSVEATSEWVACVRFAVTGKGKVGRTPPVMRQLVLDCLFEALPASASSNILAKRFTLLSAASAELFPISGLQNEIMFQRNVLQELLTSMSEPAPQVRECIGTLLCIIVSNLRQFYSLDQNGMVLETTKANVKEDLDFKALMIDHVSSALAKILDFSRAHHNNPSEITTANHNGSNHEVKEAVMLMETALYFVIAAMKSGRAAHLMEVIVEFLQPVLSLQETCYKDLSSLAKSALHIFKWQSFPLRHLPKAVEGLLSAMKDSNWRVRITSLLFLQTFMYRHVFILSSSCLEAIWNEVENLLSNSQVEVREAASSTLAGMMKSAESDLAARFRERISNKAAIYLDAARIKNRMKAANLAIYSPSAIHGTVLGLAACVLSVPYDMPSWLPATITMLVRFKSEPPPIRTTVTKTVAEFRRTHADTWAIQKSSFTEEQLEILMDISSSASYFA